MSNKKQMTTALEANGFTPSPDPNTPPWRLQLDELHRMEARVGRLKTYFELTVSREADGVVAVAMCGPDSLESMIARYRTEVAAKTKHLKRLAK